MVDGITVYEYHLSNLKSCYDQNINGLKSDRLSVVRDSLCNTSLVHEKMLSLHLTGPIENLWDIKSTIHP